MTEPGFAYACTIERPAVTGRDDETLRPSFGETTIVSNEPCAVGLIDATAQPQGTHGAMTENLGVGVHVRTGIDVRQGDMLTLADTPWDGTYTVTDVRPLAIHQRLICERSNVG
jgi:hypothetical protein